VRLAAGIDVRWLAGDASAQLVGLSLGLELKSREEGGDCVGGVSKAEGENFVSGGRGRCKHANQCSDVS